MFLALGEMTGRKIDQAAIARGLRADGVGTILGGIFNTFPYTSFSQNVGLVGVTGISSRWVTATGGVIMLVLGLLPKMSALVEAVPVGGAGRRRRCDVRHGRRDRRADPDRGRFQDQSLQPVCRRDLGRLRHDPAGGAQLLPLHAGRTASASGIGHPAGGDRLGAAQPVLQRLGRAKPRRRPTRGCSRDGRRRIVSEACCE